MSIESFLNGHEKRFPVKVTTSRSKKPRKSGGVKATNVHLCADFETTTDVDDCRVWAWGVVDITTPEYDKVHVGTDITSFIEWLQLRNSNCYFHNLKFDGMFILDWLLNNGYVHVTGDDKRTTSGTFKSLISNMGMFYSITVYWMNGHRTEFRDSYKKLPMSVKGISKSFNLETTKGEIDYKEYRPVGHKLTEQEEDYLRRDIIIPAQAMKEVLESGMTKLTVGSDSMAEYKSLKNSKWFSTTFPVLSESMDAEIRRAYRGGFTYADERFKGRVVGAGLVLDVNSLYPSVMYSRLLPYDYPEFFRYEPKPTKTHPLVIFSVTIVAKIKPNKIPCIQIKGSNRFVPTEYLKVISEPTTIFVTNVDWELYNDHYDITVIEYGGGWRFRGAKGLFNAYIDKWSKIKAESKDGKRAIAKLHLNALYGKFATNPNVTSKVPVLEDGIVKLKKGESEVRDPVYTAMGVFITAYAREVTIRSAQENYSTFAYADTDSLHLLQTNIPDNIDVHPTKLGAWKHEYDFTNAYYIRPKAYLEQHADGTYTNRIAGLPLDISSKLTFGDLKSGLVLAGKLNPKTVKGGVILRDVPFELKLS